MARHATSESDPASGETVVPNPGPTQEFDEFQRRFAVGRLRIVATLALLVVASYLASDALDNGWSSPGVLYRIPVELALILLLVLTRTHGDLIRRHVDLALVAAGCIVAFASLAALSPPGSGDVDQAILAFNQGRFAVTLVFFGLAVMVPARLRVHLTVQLATLSFFYLRMPETHAVLYAAGEWVSRAMGLLWVCLFADLSVAMFTRLQRSEYSARAQIERESAQRRRYLDGLVRVGTSGAVSDPEHQARAVLDELVSLLGAERALLYLRAQSGSLAFRVGRDAAGADVAGEEARALPGALRVPLRMRDHLVGEIVLERPKGELALSPSEEDFLRTLASHAAIALETVRTAEELRVARDAALDASRAKDTFLQTMSHELRTPVTTIIGYAEMLGEDLEEAGDAEHGADAVRIHEAAEHLLAIIADILELTQLETGRRDLKLSTFGVSELVAELDVELEPLAQRNGNRLEMTVEEAGSMISDRERVKTILRKLLQNACKFTQQGKVRCHARRVRRDGREWVEFRVSDTGVGMSEEELARCFEPFYQADPSATREYGGAGLGLTAATRLADSLEAEITARSRRGDGAEFTVTFPATSADAP